MVVLSSSLSATVYFNPSVTLKKNSCEVRTQIYSNMWKALIILRLKKKVQRFFLNDLMFFPYSVISLLIINAKSRKWKTRN